MRVVFIALLASCALVQSYAFTAPMALNGLKRSSRTFESSTSLKMKINILERVETLKVLTAVSRAGLLSKVEKAGLLSQLEKQVNISFNIFSMCLFAS
jgi:hypothetical protein